MYVSTGILQFYVTQKVYRSNVYKIARKRIVEYEECIVWYKLLSNNTCQECVVWTDN